MNSVIPPHRQFITLDQAIRGRRMRSIAILGFTLFGASDFGTAHAGPDEIGGPVFTNAIIKSGSEPIVKILLTANGKYVIFATACRLTISDCHNNMLTQNVANPGDRSILDLKAEMGS